MFVVLPVSGKSTLAGGIADRLTLPLLDKDAILEALLDALGWGTAEQRHTLSRAGDAALLALAPDNGRAVLVNWWHQDSAPTQLAGPDGPLVEVFCDCPVAVASRRFTARRRHPGHLDPDLTPAEVDARVAHLEDTYTGPLRLGGPLLTVDTTRAVDIDALHVRIRSLVDTGAHDPPPRRSSQNPDISPKDGA